MMFWDLPTSVILHILYLEYGLKKKEELISILGNNRLIHLQYFTGRLTYACVYQRVYTCMHVLLRVLVCVPPRRVYCCMYVCVYHCVYRRVIFIRQKYMQMYMRLYTQWYMQTYTCKGVGNNFLRK